MNFNFQEYQEQAIKSLRDETTLEMLALHLVEKVGAIAGVKYKALKVGADAEMIEIWLIEELGWCLWCVAAIAHMTKLEPSKSNVPNHSESQHCLKMLMLSSFSLLGISRLSSKSAVERSLGSSVANISAIAQHNNLDISAIASINLAKLSK